MTEAQLKTRNKAFALRVLKPIDSLPESRSGRVLVGQLGRSGTSVGANYRAACRSRSTAEMISDHGLLSSTKVAALHQEADELTAIMVASRRTLAKRTLKSKIENPKSKIR